MKRIYITLFILCISIFTVHAQNFEDIVRFSRQNYIGTARSAAMGGAFTALGGDISSISSNPASLGVFRKSEINFTPLLNFSKTTSNDVSQNKNSFQLGNLGAVLSFYSPTFIWKGLNFSINYSNLNNFNRKSRQIINLASNSFTDMLALSSSNTSPDYLSPFTTGLAYDAYLINQGEDGYYYSVLQEGESVAQLKDTEEKGYQGEYTFAFGTNIDDQIYLGISLGIQSVYYKMTSYFQEAPDIDSPSGLDYYSYEEYKKLDGVGTNISLGAIFRPIPEIRIGAAIHSPTWYSMNYEMSTSFNSHFITPPTDESDEMDYWAPSDLYSVDFDMRTPWRANFGIATVLGGQAIFSFDYEYIKFTDAYLQHASDDYDYRIENDEIKAYLKATHNFKAGAEFRVNDVLSLRTGYSFAESPYHEIDKKQNQIHTFAAGIGLNFGSVYFDASFEHKKLKNESVFYSYSDPEYPENDISSDPSYNKYKDNKARITFGIRF